MSTDHIFAAQMWTWPEPMIKRDSHGRILVVNAAFLHLYGGSVETWTGSPIAGWPDPQSPGQVSRFESRIPQPTGGETIYDWVECTLADGTALTLARDVTAYALTQAVVTQHDMPENLASISTDSMIAETSPVAESPASHAAAPEQPLQTPPAQEHVAPAPIAESPIADAPVTQTPPSSEFVPNMEPVEEVASTASMPETDNKPMVVAPLPIETIPTTSSPVAEGAPPEDARDFERRALPIEDQDAILGNNWRDAVIAKAAGLDDLPAEEAQEERATVETSANSGSTAGVRVLLAEDNAINALLTRTLLEAEGCHCDVVEDGALAVEAMKNGQYDMIFMDMRMPNMDGLEATRKIRAMGHNANSLPIVALTANAFDDDRNACFDSGMNDFMTKPVSAEELSEMVKTHTGLEAQAIAS